MHYIQNGNLTGMGQIAMLKTVDNIRDSVSYKLTREIWEEEKRFENPHRHYLDMSPELYKLKPDLLYEHSKQI